MLRDILWGYAVFIVGVGMVVAAGWFIKRKL
jgi:hypothetical protein